MGKRTDKELSLAARVPERERAGRCKEGEIKTIASMDERVYKGGTYMTAIMITAIICATIITVAWIGKRK